MNMTQRQRAIGIFDDILNTEAALEELDRSHFSLDRVFVIAHNTDKEQKIVGTELCESLRDRFEARINSAAKQDSNTVGGETVISLTKALTHLNIPVDTARLYNDLVAQGKYLVMVEGNQDDISGSKPILKRSGIQDWVVYKIALEHPEVIIVDRRENIT
jgi:hypothetical protein